MPPKKRGGKNKKGGKKKKEKKGLKGLQSIAELLKSVRQQYDLKCKETRSFALPDVKKLLNKYGEDSTLLAKFILTKGPPDELPVKVPPLLGAIRSTRYVYVKEMYIWDIPMAHEDVASLAIFLEQPMYPVTYLELMDCSINSYAIERFSRSFRMNNLTALLLDFNKFGDEGCAGLCKGLRANGTLLKLSMNYCDLGPLSGKILGDTVSNTAIMDLYLDGNKLGCDGVIELLKLFVDKAEMEAIEKKQGMEELQEITVQNTLGVPVTSAMGSRPTSAMSAKSKPRSASAKSSRSGTGKKGKKGKKKKSGKKKKEPPPPPPVGPWMKKLHLLDNGIDGFGSASTLGPIMCMKMFRTLITHSEGLQEIDLDDNLIGDLGGREIMEALIDRKEAGLSNLKVSVTHRMNGGTFSSIMKLGAGLKKKGKKKKKGKPGKKRI